MLYFFMFNQLKKHVELSYIQKPFNVLITLILDNASRKFLTLT